MELEKPNLTKGKRYTIEMYPYEIIVKAKYLGLSKTKEHVFGMGSDAFILAEDHWIMETNGIVSYNPVSSSYMRALRKDYIEKSPEKEKSRLTRILTDVGVKL